MIEPKNGEWWLCERGGVKTVFLRKDDEWRSDERDTYSYCDVVPLFKMIEDKPSDCAAVSQKRTRTEYEKATESIFDLRDEFERGELYFKWYGNSAKGSGGVGYDKITTENMLLCRYEEGRLLRKVEKEIDERQEFVERMGNFLGCHEYEIELEAAFEAGCRFVDRGER